LENNANLQHALDTAGNFPAMYIYPRTDKAYVLVAAEQYARVKALL
jgi:hypothetical protein